MSRSQLVLRGLLAAASLTLVVITLVMATSALFVAALVLAGLTALAAVKPDSVAVAFLLAGHVLHWVATVRVPSTTPEWVALVVAAWLGLVVHLAASLAASLPGSAPVPAVSLRRWLRRGALVAGGTVPVWAVAMLSGQTGVAGDVSLTYAAIAAVAVLALSVWLFSRAPSGQPRS